MRLLIVAAALALSFTGLRADEVSEAIVKKALSATGGDKSNSDAMSWHDKGTMTFGGMKMAYDADWTVLRPDKYHFAMKMKFGGSDVALTVALNGDKAWESDGKMTRDVTGEKLAYMKNEMLHFNVISLKPLLSDKTFDLKALGESTVDAKKCTGIQVTKKDHAPMKLYFAVDTGLLHKMETTVKDEFQNWKEVSEECVFSDWKDEGSRKVFKKLAIVRDGKPLLESEFSDAKEPEKIDAKLFEKP